MGLPEGSSSRICLPPLPPTISLRKCASVSRNASTSRAEIVNLKLDAVPAAWLRIAPVGHGLARSAGTGLVQQEAQVASREDRETGGGVKLDTETEPLGIERDRRLNVINYVTHTDRGHLWSSSDLVGCVMHMVARRWAGYIVRKHGFLACPFVPLLAIASDGAPEGLHLKARAIWSIRVPS